MNWIWRALILAVILTTGCQAKSYTVTVEPIKEKTVVVPVEEPVERFDICAQTTGEESPLRFHGHAFESKPYGCM